MIRPHVAIAGLMFAASLGAQEPAAWKAAAKFNAPSPPAWAAVSPDGKRVYLLCSERRKSPSGGAADAILFRAFDTAGKEVIARDMGLVGDVRVAMAPGRVALSDGFDRILIFDADSGSLLSTVDTRSPNDLPPELSKNVPAELRENAGGGRLTDIELTGDGKTLVTIRPENAEWKKVGPAWLGESAPAVVFWDADTGKKIGSLFAENRAAHGGYLTYMPLRKDMLVRFDTGVRLLDVAARKWGREFPVRRTSSAAVTPDEKRIAVANRDQGIKVFKVDDGTELYAFEVPAINTTPHLDGNPEPLSLAFGPTLQFVDSGNALKVTFNDGKKFAYRGAGRGEALSSAPASEVLKVSGKLIARSNDGRLAVTVLPGGKCSIWTRGE